MYATPVGLVLAGFQAIDERENRYMQMQQVQQPAKTAAPPKEARSRPQGGDFFSRINNKIKGLLIDDFDDKNDY
jgi:cell division protein FtsA